MRRATLTVAIALITLLLVACSSDDEPTPQPQPTEQTAAQTTQNQTEQPQQDRTQSNTAEQSEQPQSAQTQPDQAEQSRTEPNATEQSEQPQSTEQDKPERTESNKPEQAEQPQQTEQAERAEQSRTNQNESEQSEPEQTEQTQTQPEPEAQQSEQSQTQPNTAEQTQSQDQDQAQPEPDPSEAERLRLRAEEISANATVTDLIGVNAWLNGEETSIALELAKGNIVLIDFWTYTCINCVRTLPFLTEWDRKYRDHGLVIIGVHSPEFAFEERLENVRAAIDEHRIEYLVAIDNDHANFRAFQGPRRYWPRKFLIGPAADGSPMGVRYDHIGEGHYEETEHAIREALEAVGRDLSDIPFGVDVAVPTRETGVPRQTRELYAGWRRNVGGGGPYAGQDAYFLAGTGVDTLYRDIDTSDRQHNLWYLEGLWRIEDEAIVHARQTDQLEDYIALLVRGRTANVVLTVAEDGRPFNVYVELDGRWLFPNEAGAHVQWDDEGRSYIRVTENDLYRLLFLPEWSEHELKLRSDSDQFRIFAFTFGSYVGGE